MEKGNGDPSLHSIRLTLMAAIAGAVFLYGTTASAVTNQFRGVNWADSRDNFQSGVLYISGLSSADTYDSASVVGTAIMSQFISKLGANAVRIPINEATVSTYWTTYTGAIDAVLAKGMLVFGYWDSGKSNKPGDMNAWWAMWKTVIDKYGSNENAYFEIFNEPNMYSKTDLTNLYNDWLTRYPTVPKGRVILDGTGNAQNVPDVGSDSRLNGCLLAVHEYSFFGSESMTSESQWVSAFKGEVGSYSDRTVCTEWGAPMSPGSKNGKNYDTLDYSKPPTNYFEAYLRGMSSQLKAWNMGSFYWPGLRDGDWYSMTVKTGSGANITLTIPNQSGLQQLQDSWTGTAPNPDAGAGGSAGRDGGSPAGAGGAGGSSAGGAGGALASGGAGGAGANAGGTTGADAAVGGAGGRAGAGGLMAAGGASSGKGGAITAAGGAAGSLTTTSTSSGGQSGTSVAGSGGAGSGGSASTETSPAKPGGGSGCSCSLGGRSDASTSTGAFTLALAAVVLRMVRRRRRLGSSHGLGSLGARPSPAARPVSSRTRAR
jgi:hypothetical protein